MKTCPKCAEQVQDAAKVCKYCGHEFGFKMPQAPGCLGIVALVMIVGYCASQLQSPEDTARRDAQVAQILRQAEIERLVKSRLRDPGSATFKHFGRGCGYVNAKNGFGGMIGDKPYIVGANNKVVFEEDGSSDFRTVWDGHCAK